MSHSSHRRRRLASLLLTLAGICALAGTGRASELSVDDLRVGDLVHIELSAGGVVTGHARSYDGESLGLMTDEGMLRLEASIIASIELAVRNSDLPLPRVEIPTGEEAVQAARRARRRATRLAVGSFFVPGLGQMVTGDPGLGVLYLAGVLVIDAVIVLALALNWDVVGAVVLGGVEVSARVTSAGLSYRSGLRTYAGLVPLDGDRWAWSAGIVLRL